MEHYNFPQSLLNLKHVPPHDFIHKLQNNSAFSKQQTFEKNWAFIDANNLCRGVRGRGWQINWKSFRKYLKDKYCVMKAVIFLGYIEEHESMYRHLRQSGFALEFRPVRILKNGIIDGGNIDADLASYVMDFKCEYNKAIIVADDGDYYRTIKSLHKQKKLKLVISSHLIKHTSQLIKQSIESTMMISIHSLRNQIQQGQVA